MRHISSGHVADSSDIADDATITNVNDQKIDSSNSNIEKPEKESANKIESEETQYGSQSVSTTPVELEPHEDPKNMSQWRKIIVMSVISSGALCSTCASSMLSLIMCSWAVSLCMFFFLGQFCRGGGKSRIRCQ